MAYGGDGEEHEESLEELDEVLVVRVLATHLPCEAATVGEGSLVKVALLMVATVHIDGTWLG